MIKNLDCVSLQQLDLELEAINKVDEKLVKKYNFIPIKIIDENTIMIATSEPNNLIALDDIEIVTHMKPVAVFAKSEEIKKAINDYYGSYRTMSIALELENETKLKKEKNIDDNYLETDILDSPTVKLIDTIIEQAISKNASDIHIEPFENYIRVRIRIDGMLYKILKLDISALSGLVTRIKILSKLDISEHRIPQDGRIDMKVDNLLFDLRVSILPTIYGEKVVIRIIYSSNDILSKENIGFFDEDLDKFNKLLKNTNGIILVTGPTGSGKSTTLAAAIKDLNKENINIVTVENPVENTIEGVNQININVKAGFDFPQILRSILRQDPDIIMVGEIRDFETATIAMRAAITGHLVLSTLHTNDAVSSITRLIDMGIEPYIITSSLKAVIAQRLVRKVCPFCSQEISVSDEEMNILNVPYGTKIKKAVGCKYCNNTGYKGRFALYEIFVLDSQVYDAIYKKVGYDELKALAINGGMVTIWDNAVKNVIEGRTTLDEIYRAVYIN